MRMTREDKRLILQDRPLVLPAVLAACSALMSFRLVQWTLEQGWTDENLGFALGTLMMLGFTILMTGASRFTFDRASGRLTWTRRAFLRRYRGDVALGDVRAIFVDTLSDADGDRMWRGVIDLADGRSIPMTTAYTGDKQGWEKARQSVSEFLGLEPGDGGLDAHVRRLLREGRKMEAIKLLRIETGADLASVKQVVDHMEREAGSAGQ